MVVDLADRMVELKADMMAVKRVVERAEKMVADLAEQMVVMKADMMAVKRVVEGAE